MDARIEAKRKRVLFRCRHMGTAENDFLFGGFCERYLDGLNEDQLDALETLLLESDNDLFNWVIEKEPVPQDLDCDMMKMLKAYRKDL